MKRVLFLIASLFIISFVYSQPIFQFTGIVTKITDGDTIYVSTGGESFKVRLLGFDSPESYLFNIKDYKYYGCGYPAKNLAIKYLSGKTFSFYSDNLAKQEDKYGRKLLYAWVGTGPYGFIALNNGLASWYKWENFTFSGDYEKIDDYNKQNKIGLYNVFCLAQDNYIKKNKKYKSVSSFVDEILASKKDFHYQLQNVDFNKLLILSGNIIVIDPDDAGLTGGDIAQLKEKNNIILAYLSIGEAESYRSYWNTGWIDENGNLTSKAPDWLGPKNSKWGSYYVKYRLTGWQDIIFSKIDKIKKLGYDGLLLDTLDTYAYWEWNGTGQEYDKKMVDFIGKIRDYLGDYLAVVPNGGLPLVNLTGYLDLINGQLTESLFSINDKERSEEDRNWQLQYLNKVKDAGKVVMDIEYISGNNDLVCRFYDWIKEKGFLGAVYNLGLDSFEKITCNKVPICSNENWICSSSCNGVWKKIGNCSGGVVKSGICSSSCGGYYRVNYYQTYKKYANKIFPYYQKIKNLEFKINTAHKYPNYEKMFEKFFNKAKQKIVNNSRYWNEDFYNYLKSFIVYSEWLFVDIENKNFGNIKNYLNEFKKIIGRLKKVM